MRYDGHPGAARSVRICGGIKCPNEYLGGNECGPYFVENNIVGDAQNIVHIFGGAVVVSRAAETFSSEWYDPTALVGNLILS
jgi:hypothetical protein